MSDWREMLLGVGAGVSGGAGLLASMLEGGEVAGWVERIGLPTAALLAIGYLLVRFFRWAGVHVVQPVVAKHVAFVDAVETVSRKTQACVERIEASEASREAAAAEDRRAAAEDRKTTRIAVEGVREALDRLVRQSEKAKPAA